MYRIICYYAFITTPVEILSTTEARRRLPELLRDFRARGERADPVLLGAHRRPTGVLMSYESYRGLLDYLDDLAIAETVRERLSNADSRTLTLDELSAAVKHLDDQG